MFQGKGFEVKLDAEFPPDPVFDLNIDVLLIEG